MSHGLAELRKAEELLARPEGRLPTWEEADEAFARAWTALVSAHLWPAEARSAAAEVVCGLRRYGSPQETARRMSTAELRAFAAALSRLVGAAEQTAARPARRNGRPPAEPA